MLLGCRRKKVWGSFGRCRVGSKDNAKERRHGMRRKEGVWSSASLHRCPSPAHVDCLKVQRPEQLVATHEAAVHKDYGFGPVVLLRDSPAPY